jgi:hypothetical protein
VSIEANVLFQNISDVIVGPPPRTAKAVIVFSSLKDIKREKSEPTTKALAMTFP